MNLVVGVAGHPRVVVDEALVQGVLHRLEGDVVAPVCEDGRDAVGLLHAVTTYIYMVGTGEQVLQVVGHQVEILVEHGLRRGVPLDGGLRLEVLAPCPQQGAEVFCVLHEVHAVHLLQPYLFLGVLAFVQGFLVEGIDAVGDEVVVGIAYPRAGVDELEEGDERRLLAPFEVGDDGDFVQFVLRQLRLDVEDAYRLHLVAEEVDAERHFEGIGEDVHDAPAHGELPWLIHEVHPLEAVCRERFGDEVDAHAFAHPQGQHLPLDFGR